VQDHDDDSAPQRESDRIDTTIPHPARRYNYWLGGKDNFRADRASADAIAAAFPHLPGAARENRAFLRRAVRTLAAEAGIRQFLDIGTGLPTADNTHEVAQAIDPQARIVYVDNDPLVLTYARALLAGTEQGATAYIDADLREPARILNDPATRATLDFTQPVALMLVAILHFVPDGDNPHAIVKELVDALAPGSFVVLSHATFDPLDAGTVARLDRVNAGSHPPFCPRTLDEVARFFPGLRLLEPGIVSVADWRAADEPQPRPAPAEVAWYGAVAHKPT
jgi:SAM-dependent methyltransferase